MVPVAEASNNSETLEQHRKHKPDIVLMDLKLPDTDGFNLIRQLCQEIPPARVVVFSSYGGDENVFRALKAGARAYLLKSESSLELNAAIRAVHGGQTYLPTSAASGLAQYVSNPSLSEREFEVLIQIGCGKNNGEIAAALKISEITVKRHIGQIFQKLAVHDRTQAMTVAIQRGILRIDELHAPLSPAKTNGK